MPVRLLSVELDGEVAEFSRDGATLVAETVGPGAPRVLLLHGLGMGRSVFADLVPRLPGAVVAVDLPGFGEAPEPPRPLSMPAHADLVAAHLRGRGGGPVLVIGHSMGTQVAAELAARYPELVAGVVLAAPTVDDGARGVARQALRFLQDLASLDPRVVVRGAREYLRAGPHLGAKIRATVDHRPEQVYPRITSPVLVLRGERDPVCPAAWCRAVTAAMADARMAEVPGHGHETMISDAAPAAELISGFLAGIPAPGSP